MSATLCFAEGEADHESIYRLRYDIYVEETAYRFPGVDHERRRLVEVVRDGRHVALMTRGEVFGEVAFLLGGERTADVLAATEARVIALRERALNELIAAESRIAARFLLNLARIACLKLAGDTDMPPAGQAK